MLAEMRHGFSCAIEIRVAGSADILSVFFPPGSILYITEMVILDLSEVETLLGVIT